MIHRDAHHLGIAAIAGNRGNGEFDGHLLALVMKHVGMSKINGLTRHVALSEKEGQLALYMLEERDVRGHPVGQSFLMRAFHMCFQGWGHTIRQGRFSSRCISQSSNHVYQVTYTSASPVQCMPVVSNSCSCQPDCLVCGRGEELHHDFAIHVLLESMVFQERMLHGEPTEAKLEEILQSGKEYLPQALTDQNSVRWQTMYHYVHNIMEVLHRDKIFSGVK
ncbi:uncharacterized protein TNCV_874371 [Trichonephila clavipes]|nr:uncharacterized protein TNCV_874371 [Trichonephila clavipes]